MYKELIKLWWTQKRRSFTWKDVAIGLYGYFLLACMLGGMYFGNDGEMGELLDIDFADYAMVMVTCLLFMDLVGKIFIKKEASVMDDYLRSRPISQRTWNAFVVTVTLMDYWTWAFTIGVALVSFLLLPWALALAVTAASLSASLVNALALTCYRRADQWWLRVPMVVVLVLFLAGSIVYGLIACAIFTPAWQAGCYTVLNLIALAILFFYMTQLHCYDERKETVARVRRINVASRFALDWAAVWRPKRIRQMVIIITLIMIVDVYLNLSTGADGFENANNFLLLFAVSMPSVVLAQWTFGVEANFFHGLWTKPMSVNQLLTNKFYFFAILNGVAAALLLPAVLCGWLGLLKLLAILVFTVGVINPTCLPTCLFSERLDLFSSAFFNYQGASTKINVYALICLLPEGIAWTLYYFLPEQPVTIALLALGLVGIAVSPLVLRRLSAAYVARRHARFEAYTK